MRKDSRRISLVARSESLPHRDWDDSRASAARIVFVETMPVLSHAVRGALFEMNLDIERVVIDRTADADQLLTFLSTLPPEFHGDVVFIKHDDSGYLSATGRGGDRVLYRLSEHDVRFYLEAHGLVTGRLALTA